MVKYTLADAQAFAETRRRKLDYQGWNKRYCVTYPGSTFTASTYKTLDGAVKSMCFDNGGEFERWLIQRRQAQP